MRKNQYKMIIVFLTLMTMIGLLKAIPTEEVSNYKNKETVMIINDKLEKKETQSYVEYSYHFLEDMEDKDVLSLESYYSGFEVYLDQKRLYQYQDDYQEKGINRHWVRLPRHLEGKELRIRFSSQNAYDEETLKANIYMGNSSLVIMNFIKENIVACLFFFVCVLISLFIALCLFFLRKELNENTKIGIASLGIFILLTAIWVITDSKILQLLFENTAMMSFISFFSFMCMPIFLIQFINEMMVHKYKIFNQLCYAYCGYIFIAVLCYALRILPLYKSLIVLHILMIISIVAILKLGLTEIKKYKNVEMKYIITGFACLSVVGILSLSLFYFSPTLPYSYLYSIGFMVFIFFLIMAALKRVHDYINKSASQAVYKKLAYIDTLAVMGNRTAFVDEQDRKIEATSLTYIIFDINDLKYVNDSFGHQLGDRLIGDVATCIRETFDHVGKCYRIGGDEFAVIIYDAIQKEIDFLLREFDHKIVLMNEHRDIPLSVAYGYCCRDKIDNEEIFKEADQNMYIKKKEMKKQK